MPTSKLKSGFVELQLRLAELRNAHSLSCLDVNILCLIHNHHCSNSETSHADIHFVYSDESETKINNAIDELIVRNYLNRVLKGEKHFGYVLTKKSRGFLDQCDNLLNSSNQSKNSPGVLYTCIPSGAFPATYISENTLELFGFDHKEFLINPNFWLDHIHPIDKQSILENLPALFKNDIHTHQYRFKTATGSYIWVEDRLRLKRDPQGEPLEITGFMTPIYQSLLDEFDIESLDMDAKDFSNAYQNLLEEKKKQKLLIDKVNLLEGYTIKALLELSKFKDDETSFHIIRTQNYVEVIARYLKSKDLLDDASDDYVLDLCKAAPLHDVGKIFINDDILKKPAKLEPAEWEIMKTHAALGQELLKNISSNSGTATGFIARAIEITGNHHENWDGTGYPLGLSKTDIPQSARIMAVADCFDALISKRYYKDAWTYEEAFAEIHNQSGFKFDPMVVEALEKSSELIIEIAEMYRE